MLWRLRDVVVLSHRILLVHYRVASDPPFIVPAFFAVRVASRAQVQVCCVVGLGWWHGFAWRIVWCLVALVGCLLWVWAMDDGARLCFEHMFAW